MAGTDHSSAEMWVSASPRKTRDAPLLFIVLMCFTMYAVSLPSGKYGHRLLEEEVMLQKQAASAAVGVLDYQAAALAEFASGLDADPYGSLPLWTGESHPCGDASNNFQRWPGVVCNAPTGLVTAIELPNKGLSGTLPRSLSVLKSLRTLDLSNNSFYGTLPTTWGNLTALATLKLSMNHLTGLLPDTFSACESMQSIELNFNQLTGSLPGSWAAMNLLEMLDLSANHLNGTLPNAWSRMEFLSVLDLHKNDLSGTLPAAWPMNLLQMNLGANNFEGVLPAEWAGGMASLRGMNIAENNISGSLPDEWSKMKSLQTLSVSNNQITGSVPATWGNLHGLYNVNITSNEGICGDVPASVSGVLGGTNSTSIARKCPWEMDADNLLAFKAALTNRDGVLDTWKQGSNPCPEGDGAAPWNGVGCADGEVIMVILPGCKLAGPLTGALGRLSQLKAIHLGHNKLTGMLPADWGAATSSLVAINLTANELSGPLPRNWGHLTALQHLDLSDNQLEGPLPSEWSNMVNLATLLLGLNRHLSGTLPESWSELSALEKAHLDFTSIQGSLPASWAKLTRMQQLGLANNMLTGAVPMEWESINGTVDVTGNQLMCGAQLPDTVQVQKAQTDLGKRCRTGDKKLSIKEAIAVGICSSFAGAALLAGTALLIFRARHAATVRQAAALRASAAAVQAARPLTLATPGPATDAALPAPPCSPALSAFGRPSAANPAAAAAAALAGIHPPQHRLASTTSAALAGRTDSESPTPPTPRSPAGPVRETAAVGKEQQRMQLLGSPLSNLRHSSTPASPSSGCSASPLSVRPFATSSAASALPVVPAARFTATTPNTQIGIDSSSPVPLACNTSISGDGTSTTAATAGHAADGMRPAIILLPMNLDSMSVSLNEVMTDNNGEQTPRNTMQYMPGSTGAWGSAVKTYDHDNAPEASGTPGHNSMRLGSLRACMQRFIGREAAAEAAGATAASVTHATAAAEEALALAAVDPVEAPAATTAAMATDSVIEAPAEGSDGRGSDVDAGSPIAHGSRGVSGLTALVWPHSPMGNVAEGPGVSPRGVAALMAAGAGGTATPAAFSCW